METGKRWAYKTKRQTLSVQLIEKRGKIAKVRIDNDEDHPLRGMTVEIAVRDLVVEEF